jgi:hypothetical protein
MARTLAETLSCGNGRIRAASNEPVKKRRHIDNKTTPSYVSKQSFRRLSSSKAALQKPK